MAFIHFSFSDYFKGKAKKRHYPGLEVVDALLVGEDEHEGVQDCLVVDGLFDLVLDVHPDKTLHVLVLPIPLVLVC